MNSGWMAQTGSDEIGGWQLGRTYEISAGETDTVVGFVTRLDWRGTSVIVRRVSSGREWPRPVEHATPRDISGARLVEG